MILGVRDAHVVVLVHGVEVGKGVGRGIVHKTERKERELINSTLHLQFFIGT